jgi:hypothetical protein
LLDFIENIVHVIIGVFNILNLERQHTIIGAIDLPNVFVLVFFIGGHFPF